MILLEGYIYIYIRFNWAKKRKRKKVAFIYLVELVPKASEPFEGSIFLRN